jgi:spermidine synthase
MGATLPTIARWVESSRRGVSWLGFFYGGNIIGAVLGSVSAGFYLLRVHDQAYATYVAALLNFVIAGIAWLIAALSPVPVATAEAPSDDVIAPGPRAVYVAIGISGASALAAEVVWTRLLSLTFGASTYTFSMILAVFLTGLGIGSSFGAWLARVVPPRRAFAWCQLLLMFAIAWGAAVIFVALPNWPINPSIAPSAWFTLQLDLVRCALAVLPAACLWGASFPLALAALVEPGQDASRLVGRLYAANTVGAILGALVCSLILIPVVGTRDAQRVLIALSAIGGVLLLVSQPRDAARTVSQGVLGPVIAAVSALLLIATMGGGRCRGSDAPTCSTSVKG